MGWELGGGGGGGGWLGCEGLQTKIVFLFCFVVYSFAFACVCVFLFLLFLLNVIYVVFLLTALLIAVVVLSHSPQFILNTFSVIEIIDFIGGDVNPQQSRSLNAPIVIQAPTSNTLPHAKPLRVPYKSNVCNDQ